MHCIIPNRYIYPSGNFHSWMFASGRGGNRTTKLCLILYLFPLTSNQKVMPVGWLTKVDRMFDVVAYTRETKC